MEKYVVSARKYRPTNFKDVVGQNHVTTTLKNAINNNKMYDLLGREVFEVPIGEVYIKNNRKCIRIK